MFAPSEIPKPLDNSISSESGSRSTPMMKISDIKIGKRFRKDLGDIQDFSENIKNNGLLCPITLTKREHLLIDGARRIEAYKLLGLSAIPIHIIDIPIKENGEIDANLFRKGFTVEEILAIKKYRESIEPNLQGKRTDLTSALDPSHQLQGNFPRGLTEKRRQERIAENTGLSYKSLVRLEEVAHTEKEHPNLGDLTRKIDSGVMKINQAWKIVNSHKKREQTIAEAKKLEKNKLPKGLQLFHGDCRQLIQQIDDNSVDLIFTDPPYDRESLYLYTDLGRMAERVLKPGGSLIFYAPHYALLHIGSTLLQPGLKQKWTFSVKHTGHLSRNASLHLRINWKPLIWLVKGDSQPNVIPDANFDDFIISTPPDKSLHDRAQSPAEADYIIKHLTVENQIVLDCFMGSGTTGKAAISNKRQFIGIEIDKQTFEEAKANITGRNSRSTITLPKKHDG